MLLLPLAALATTFAVSDKGSAFASLHVTLDAGDSVRAEPGSLVSYRGDVCLGIRSGSGWLGRMFAGEAPYTTSLSAGEAGGECMLCPRRIGDIQTLELASDEAICLSSGCFLAADSTVSVKTESHHSLSRTLFSGTGLRYLMCAGPGTCAFNGHGGLHSFRLAEGEKLVVDNGHVVGWSPGLQITMEWAVQNAGSGSGAFFRSIASGEGLVCRFEGPGEVWCSTHIPPPQPS
mmetsp:Transcript_65833/g.130496  ORF Transcript_65833/g.130496 Transcript_65833/m.130496 type:complete len:233 (-) Transcript_65833:230-928(-)